MPPELGPVAGELPVLDRRLLTARGRAGRDAVGGKAFPVALAVSLRRWTCREIRRPSLR
jgi:hypothetical protein